MRILYLINYLGGGGTENYIYSLAREFNKEDEVYLVYSEKAEGYEKFSQLNIELIHMEMKSSFDFTAAKNLKKICRERNIDVVHTNFLRENYIALLTKFLGAEIKVINTRHMLDENTGPVKIVNRIMTRHNKSIIAVSQAVRDLLYRELGHRKNIDLIYTGLDLSYWSRCESRSLKGELGLEDELVVTSVSRFSEEKGNDFLLKSIKKLVDEYNLSRSEIKFLLVGSGSLLDPMKELADDLGIGDYIIFTGYRDDIRDILNISDIFVLSSQKEAFGISILEAMAMELPVIATKVGGIPEIITSSEYGQVVEYNDIEAMAAGLGDLISNKSLREDRARRGLEHVRKNFSIEKTLLDTRSLYE